MSPSNDVILRCILFEEAELFFQLLGGTYCEQNERRLFGPSRTLCKPSPRPPPRRSRRTPWPTECGSILRAENLEAICRAEGFVKFSPAFSSQSPA